MALLETKHLSFSYPEQKEECLNDISFTIEKGEFVLVFGETGCGKSTLLKQWKPSICPAGTRKGEVLFSSKSVETMNQRVEACKIGYVTQNPDQQIVTDRVWHELAFNLENLGIEEDEIRRRVAEIAVFFGITSWFHSSISQLSGGQKQILNLAAIMITRPELLLLDEPTSQLDPIATENFMNLLARIHTELGTTIVLAEHRLEEAYAKVNRCMFMENGKVLCFAKQHSVTKFLLEHHKEAFLLLPLQARFPAKIKQVYSISTISGAKQFVEQNIQKVMKQPADIGLSWDKKREILAFQHVWFRYEKNGTDILKDFSLQISEGQFLAIVGGNGQGKSTYLSLAAGIQRPYRGKVRKKKGAMVSLLPQNPQDLFWKDTVKEELTSISEKIEWVVEKLQIGELLDKHPYDLSGGQQQTVALGKVLLTKPDILLLDEPTKGVDQIRKKKLGKLFMQLNKEGITIIMVSHDVDFCATYAKQCGMIFDGRMTAFGDRHSFFLGQYFFTTTFLKICRNVYEGMIIEEEVYEYEMD